MAKPEANQNRPESVKPKTDLFKKRFRFRFPAGLYCHASLVIKCVVGINLLTNFNKVWMGGMGQNDVVSGLLADYFEVRRKQKHLSN
jgi:hypothetical protein